MKLKQLFSRRQENIAYQFTTPEMYKTLLRFFGFNVKVNTDVHTDEYIKKGYEGNADVFSIVTDISVRFSSIPKVPYIAGTDKISNVDPVKEMFARNSYDKSLTEHEKEWILFGLINGNQITQISRYEYGNDRGKPFKLSNLPWQDMYIESKGLQDPPLVYKFNVGEENIEIHPDNIWHNRPYPNLIYTDGRNMDGLSPVKVALMIILAQNYGYEMSANIFSKPIPPFIINNKGLSVPPTEPQYQDMLKKWRQRVGNVERAGDPYFMSGDVNIHRLGYDNLNDIKLIESSEHGLRVLCNIWGYPSELMNDPKASTFNNESTAAKSIYTRCIIPHMNMYLEGLNKIIKPYYNIEYKADYSEIQALQEDKEKKARIYQIGLQNGAVTENEYRTNVLGLEEWTTEELEEHRTRNTFNDLDNVINNLDQEKL